MISIISACAFLVVVTVLVGLMVTWEIDEFRRLRGYREKTIPRQGPLLLGVTTVEIDAAQVRRIYEKRHWGLDLRREVVEWCLANIRAYPDFKSRTTWYSEPLQTIYTLTFNNEDDALLFTLKWL